jgi:glycerol-3-phosphate O-acyltransferase/dihydroxyacetone phosphate acyltransferase
MELRLVYRILRKISEWALVDFYSEVYVDDGQQTQTIRVPKDAPIILYLSSGIRKLASQ